MLKPASGCCNMDCGYCFYKDEMRHRTIADFGMMQKETVNILIQRVFSETEEGCSFSFQGGEPCLLPLSFYESFVEMQKQYNKKKIPVSYTLQTNGTFFNQAWACFLKEHNFLVGISLDGIKRLHNRNRPMKDGSESFHLVMQGISYLQEYEIPFHVLTVVTKELARSAKKIYEFYKKKKLYFQQYIPCIPWIEADKVFLSAEEYAIFLKDLFDCWYQDMSAGTYVYIRYFENLAGMLKGEKPEHCGRMGICGEQWIVEADGSVYPCDFYVLDSWKIGNIREDSFSKMREQRKATLFTEESKILSKECMVCEWFPLCRNGCKRERMVAGIHQNKNQYCLSYKEFFPYALERLKRLL